jgi:hypothetical protein
MEVPLDSGIFVKPPGKVETPAVWPAFWLPGTVPGSSLEGYRMSGFPVPRAAITPQYIDLVHREHAVTETGGVRTAKALDLRNLPRNMAGQPRAGDRQGPERLRLVGAARENPPIGFLAA